MVIKKKGRDESNKYTNKNNKSKPLIIGGIVVVAVIIIVVFLTSPVGEAIRIRTGITPRTVVSTRNLVAGELNCRDNVDNDGNGRIDEDDANCRGRQCDAGRRVWTWSRTPGDLGYGELRGGTRPLTVSCCLPSQCAGYYGDCINYEQVYNTEDVQEWSLICGDNGQWDRCYDARSGASQTNNEGRLLYTHYPVSGSDISDGAGYRCQNGVWLPVQ